MTSQEEALGMASQVDRLLTSSQMQDSQQQLPVFMNPGATPQDLHCNETQVADDQPQQQQELDANVQAPQLPALAQQVNNGQMVMPNMFGTSLPFMPTSNNQPVTFVLGAIDPSMTSDQLQLQRHHMPEKHHSLNKKEHEDSRAKRRGPMDEMRQLVRIMVKLFPQSTRFMSSADEPGGGNRVTETQIRRYLKDTLGEAPAPQWGLPDGWGSYVSELFTWALDKPISDEEARECACRQPGRSWHINETKLSEMGLFTYSWPLPLTKEGVRRKQADPGAPPPGHNFLGPPPGWPNVELEFWRRKRTGSAAPMTMIQHTPMQMQTTSASGGGGSVAVSLPPMSAPATVSHSYPAYELRPYTPAELAPCSEDKILQLVLPLMRALSNKEGSRDIKGSRDKNSLKRDNQLYELTTELQVYITNLRTTIEARRALNGMAGGLNAGAITLLPAQLLQTGLQGGNLGFMNTGMMDTSALNSVNNAAASPSKMYTTQMQFVTNAPQNLGLTATSAASYGLGGGVKRSNTPTLQQQQQVQQQQQPQQQPQQQQIMVGAQPTAAGAAGGQQPGGNHGLEALLNAATKASQQNGEITTPEGSEGTVTEGEGEGGERVSKRRKKAQAAEGQAALAAAVAGAPGADGDAESQRLAAAAAAAQQQQAPQVGGMLNFLTNSAQLPSATNIVLPAPSPLQLHLPSTNDSGTNTIAGTGFEAMGLQQKLALLQSNAMIQNNFNTDAAVQAAANAAAAVLQQQQEAANAGKATDISRQRLFEQMLGNPVQQ